MEDILRVGVITTTHGLRGEVKVFPTTDDPKRFKKLKEVLLDTGKERRKLQVESVRFQKNLVILKFKEFDSINDVEQYKKCDLYVSRKNAVKLEENENFIVDLIGMHVVLEDGTEFGIMKDVLQTGANDVYIVEMLDGREVLLPAIPECILDVDLDSETMTIHLMKGLLD
ncbi:MAG TPA: ribosome maturation factor RimM [Candidatus Fimousia stercorigallinarum]|nr:ribosome maturation factor RimM [Candidatus Fimousia stercorigallinarum]